EVAFGAFGEDDHHQNHTYQTAVEGHAPVPDAEQVKRIVQENREVVEQHIADTPTKEYPEESGIEQVFNFIFRPSAARTTGATTSKPHGKDEADQVHKT